VLYVFGCLTTREPLNRASRARPRSRPGSGQTAPRVALVVRCHHPPWDDPMRLARQRSRRRCYRRRRAFPVHRSVWSLSSRPRGRSQLRCDQGIVRRRRRRTRLVGGGSSTWHGSERLALGTGGTADHWTRVSNTRPKRTATAGGTSVPTDRRSSSATTPTWRRLAG
jgi:hypothetical protein